MELELHGHVAVVTGGASGIGLACAERLAREGCDVALWDVARDVSGVAADLAKEFGRCTLGISVDVSKLESVTAALEQTEKELGPVTHLVHSAAVTSGQFGFPFTNVATTSWQRVLDVNVMGMVQTPLNKQVWAAWNEQQPVEKRRTYDEWAGDKVRNVIPLGRWQSVDDIADMVTFLSSARTAQVTGQTINVDGGFVMHW